MLTPIPVNPNLDVSVRVARSPEICLTASKLLWRRAACGLGYRLVTAGA